MARKTKAAAGQQPSRISRADLKPVDSEVEAYGFIREQLADLGWNLKDPSRHADGQVWTQNQCLAHPHLKAALGKTRPENIVKLNEKLVWVIEAKASRQELGKALDEAVDFYAGAVNKTHGKISALLATGVAGTEDSGYLMRTKVRINGRWKVVTINNREATGLLSPDDVRRLIESNESDVHDFTPPPWLFIHAAERINGILHSGGINRNDRAKTMAALLLSVIHEPPNLETSLQVLIGEINTRSKSELTENGKPEFAPYVEILPPTNRNNHVNFKGALVKTILQLQNLNIRSAMNSSSDVLGQFYEVFLKYGNGAKEIGIVLTPRHITRFAVDAVGIGPKDLLLDPACGTGGFLVAAFDHVRRNCAPAQLERFKKHNLFGIENDPSVAVLAIVNMIFRGDGKNNITEGNCHSTHIVPKSVEGGHASAEYGDKPPVPGNEPITRVLMNPPFAVEMKEYKFVSRALSFMADGGLLFTLLPLDAMFGASEEKTWRADDLLKKHTLLAVITLPDQLFTPAALKQVVAVIVKKGVPHPRSLPVFWGRAINDGYVVSKSKRMAGADMRPPRNTQNDLDVLLPLLQGFLSNPTATSLNKPLLYKTAPIDFEDPLLELLPEVYIDSKPVRQADIEHAADDLARETAAFLIRFRKEAMVEKLDADN